MRRALICLAFLGVAVASRAEAEAPLSDNAQSIKRCLYAAAGIHRVPPAVLVVLLNVEGGSLGHVSQNTNATVDIGPMQVNQIWIPQVAAHWHATPSATFLALRDNFCANVEAGAWILRQGLDEARGDFWQGVGYYHSHDPEYKASYLQAVLKQVLRLRAAAEKSQAKSQSIAAAPRDGATLQPGAR